MKIIDLLNKIANGEEVSKKIKYKNIEYEYKDVGYYNKQRGYLFDGYYPEGILDDEVEILDEPKKDKIEYLDDFYKDDRFGYSIDLQKVKDKINEIIDYLKSKGE